MELPDCRTDDRDRLSDGDQERIVDALRREDYSAALAVLNISLYDIQILSSIKCANSPTEAMKLNELFLSSLAGEDNYLEGVQLFLSEYDDRSILFFIDVLSNAIFVAGRKNDVRK